MKKLTLQIYLITLCCLLCLYNSPLCIADNSLDDTRKLLQKSLTLYELDQEISRLSDQEAGIAAQIAGSTAEIGKKAAQVAETRKHAGKVLRAYYMGERIQIWLFVFSAKSFTQALDMYEYLNAIIQNDHKALAAYQTAYRALQESKSQLEAEQAELEQVKNDFIKQRERMMALQKEVDEQLAQTADAQTVKSQMADLTVAWQEKGIPLFKTYFQALSDVMQSLPELMAGNNKEKYFNGLTFQISDEDLNRFFRTKNSIFNNLTIRFANGVFIADGKDDTVDISIKGGYTIENKPRNKLLFHVEELTFNGFVLPDTTARTLEQEFDLGFSPGLVVPFVEATEVQISEGKLTVKLKLNFQ